MKSTASTLDSTEHVRKVRRVIVEESDENNEEIDEIKASGTSGEYYETEDSKYPKVFEVEMNNAKIISSDDELIITKHGKGDPEFVVYLKTTNEQISHRICFSYVGDVSNILLLIKSIAYIYYRCRP